MANKIKFDSLSAFELIIEYNNLKYFPLEDEPPSHIHDSYEIYFNLSGDVSFMVENHTYPISRGNIIITKPFEYHHCIYHSNKEHEHYCLRFSSCERNELFEFFHTRERGKNNHIPLSNELAYSFKKHIDAILSDCNNSLIDKYYHFIRLMQIIQNNASVTKTSFSDDIPESLLKVLNIISDHYDSTITVANLASEIFVSVNTLERHFKRYLNITPREYIKRKRLSEAMILLNKNTSVTQVAYKCGFPDTSNFIRTFKHTFGQTPYQYLISKKL